MNGRMLNKIPFSRAWDLTFRWWLQAGLQVAYMQRECIHLLCFPNTNTWGLWCAKAAFRFSDCLPSSGSAPLSHPLAVGWLRSWPPNYKGHTAAGPHFLRASNPVPRFFQPGSSSLEQGKFNFYLHAKHSLPVPFAFLAPQELPSQRWDTAASLLHFCRATQVLLNLVFAPFWALVDSAAALSFSHRG